MDAYSLDSCVKSSD